MRLSRSFFLVCCALLSVFVTTSASGESKRPNILFAIADDWSYGHAGAYGSKWVKTPAFDRIAKAGVLFTRAYTPNAKCAPSRACLLTGRNSWQLKEAGNHMCFFPSEFTSYPEALAQNGYYVGYTGKGWGPGVANDKDGNRRRIAGTQFSRKRSKPPAQHMSNIDYAANFSEFLASRSDDKPWCFWYGAYEPHRRYQPKSGVKLGGKKLSDIERVPSFFPDNDTIRHDLLDYAYEVEHFDNHLSRMLKELEAKGLLENTLVVATSDHGMPFPRCKGQAYDYSNHVPLAIMWPRTIKKRGRTVTDYVSFVDIAPTFLEAAGLSWNEAGMQPTPGQSLMSILRSEKEGQVDPRRDHVVIGKERHDVGRPNDQGYPIRGIVQGGWLYIRNYETSRWPAGDPVTGYLNCDGGATKTFILDSYRSGTNREYWELCFGRRVKEELYNLHADPDCVRNLAGEKKQADRVTALRERMVKRLTQQNDPRMMGKKDYFEKMIYSDTRTRGFYERLMKGEKMRAGWVNPGDFEKPSTDKK